MILFQFIEVLKVMHMKMMNILNAIAVWASYRGCVFKNDKLNMQTFFLNSVNDCESIS